MKKPAILLLCIFIHSFVLGQNFDDIILTNPRIDCSDVTYNAHDIVRGSFELDAMDSIYRFIDYWEAKCGTRESTFRLKNILDIETGKFDKNNIQSDWIDRLINYQSDYLSPIFFHPYTIRLAHIKDDWSSEHEEEEFSRLTKEIASFLSPNNFDEAFIKEYYQSDFPSFRALRDDAPDDSRLKYYYNEKLKEAEKMSQFHFAVITGYIQNYGNIELFGLRPTIGFIFGEKILQHNYDIVLDFRLGPSKESYTFEYEDQILEDDNYTGIYLGFEYTYDFISKNKFDVGISPGIGYDGVQAIGQDNDFGEDSKFLSSFNFNSGLVFKYHFGNNGGYAGLHLRYNWANYANGGGTELSGNYFNLRLTVGGLGNASRSYYLDQLNK